MSLIMLLAIIAAIYNNGGTIPYIEDSTFICWALLSIADALWIGILTRNNKK